MKHLHTFESFLNEMKESKGFKNNKDFEKFLEEIDGMPEAQIKKIMGKDYIDTPGGYREEGDDYNNDIIEYMMANMGRKEFEKLQDWWTSNVAESVVDKNFKPLLEGQFSWLTHDSNTQIGSEKQNTISVTMFDDKGNKWAEEKYEGYGKFGGKDYFELLAEMNGIENANRKDGIDIAFGKKKVKGKVLFPALIEDARRFNYKNHDFTKEAKNDPNQSWYQEEEEEDYNESVVNEAPNLEIHDLLVTMDKEKAGPKYKNALMALITMAEKISGKTIRTKEEALAALDYTTPETFKKR